MFNNEAFEHWLFVCGTFVIGGAFPRTPAPVYFNSCLVVKGGGNHAPSSLVHKELVAPDDNVLPLENAWDTAPLKAVHKRWHVRRQRIIDVDKLHIGVEVCLDHSHGVLSTVREEQAKVEPGSAPLDIQILVACGLGLSAAGLATKVGGYVMRNDGCRGFGPQSNVHQVEEGDSEGELKLGPSVAEQLAITVPPEFRYRTPGNMDGFTERVVIYPPLKL
jgi:hypothetical protein